MAKYVAFLKAINVGGHVVKMSTLRDVFADLKFSSVETFIASGNIIFETASTPDRRLEQKIEKHLESALGYEVETFVRSIEEIHAIGKYQAFSSDALKGAQVVNVGFLHEALTASVAKEVKSFHTEVDDFHVHGREAYWLCRIRQSDSKFSAKKFEKAVGGPATWRNINTIVRLAARYSH